MRNLKKITLLALASLILATGSTLAAAGIATGAVNVRTGPNTGFTKVDNPVLGRTGADRRVPERLVLYRT